MTRSRVAAEAGKGMGRWVRVGSAMLLFGWAMLSTAPAPAAIAESDLVWILESETVPEDLYAVGNDIRVEGRIEGDLVAVAGGRLEVTGVVTGSLTALAATVVIEGEVGGSVRVAAPEMIVNGRVGGDVLTAAFHLTVDGEVGRDLLAAAWSARAGGRVQRDLRGFFRSLSLDGTVAEDVEVRARGLVAEEGMSVLGDFDYQAEDLLGEHNLRAGVEGSLINRKALPPNVRIRAMRLMTVLFVSLVMVAAGLLILRWQPRRVEAASLRAIGTPWRSLGKGLALLLSPLVGLAGLVTVVLWLPVYIWGPLVLGVIPFLTMAAGFWLLALFAAHIPVAVAVGRWVGRILGRRPDPAWAYLIGAIIYLSVLQIPVLGGPVVALITAAGAGAWLGRGKQSESRPTGQGSIVA